MSLIKKLTTETKQLKKSYLEKTKIWAKKEFNQLKELSNLDVYDLGKTLGFEIELKEDKYNKRFYKSFKKINNASFYNSKESLKLDSLKNKISKALFLGEKGYIEKKIEAGVKHYNNSIKKLAERIDKKGLNKKNLKLKTSFLDPNINTQITDGKKNINAYTIIAGGPIQKPHYRYILK